MQFGQKYTIIQLLESVPEGTEFSSTNWPLHVTLVDVFATDWDVATMADQLASLLQQYKPFISTTAGETFFGPHQETQVTLVQKTPELATLHYALIALLGQGNLRLNDPQFAQDGFLPHATVQSHARLNVGDTVPFTALSIVDMFPAGDPYKRRILKTISMVA